MNSTLERLRSEFDQSFAAPATAAVAFDDFLAVKVGGVSHAISLGQLASLHRDKKVVPLLTPRAHRLGLLGFRGTIAPVFDLRSVLGLSTAEPARWLVLTRGSRPLALAFDSFESYLRVPRQPGQADVPLRAVGNRPIIDLASVAEALTKER